MHIWSDENPHPITQNHHQHQFSLNVWASLWVFTFSLNIECLMVKHICTLGQYFQLYWRMCHLTCTKTFLYLMGLQPISFCKFKTVWLKLTKTNGLGEEGQCHCLCGYLTCLPDFILSNHMKIYFSTMDIMKELNSEWDWEDS